MVEGRGFVGPHRLVGAGLHRWGRKDRPCCCCAYPDGTGSFGSGGSRHGFGILLHRGRFRITGGARDVRARASCWGGFERSDGGSYAAGSPARLADFSLGGVDRVSALIDADFGWCGTCTPGGCGREMDHLPNGLGLPAHTRLHWSVSHGGAHQWGSTSADPSHVGDCRALGRLLGGGVLGAEHRKHSRVDYWCVGVASASGGVRAVLRKEARASRLDGMVGSGGDRVLRGRRDRLGSPHRRPDGRGRDSIVTSGCPRGSVPRVRTAPLRRHGRLTGCSRCGVGGASLRELDFERIGRGGNRCVVHALVGRRSSGIRDHDRSGRPSGCR